MPLAPGIPNLGTDCRKQGVKGAKSELLIYDPRRALDTRKRMVSTNPANRKNRRDLGITYERIGDTLGNPNMPNLADLTGAVENYYRMQAIYQQLLDEQQSDLLQQHTVAIGYEKARKD